MSRLLTVLCLSALIASCDDGDGESDSGAGQSGTGASSADSGRPGAGSDASASAGEGGSVAPRDAALPDAARDDDGGADRDGATATPLPERCTLPRDGGDCDGLFFAWYHDAESRTCQSFGYGGCGGNANRFASLAECEAACDVTPRSEPCSVTASDPSLPGVNLLVEGVRCRVLSGRSHGFLYRLEVEDSISYQQPDSGGACGRCGGYTSDPLSLIDYSIGDGAAVQYCVCDVGCCPPTTPASRTLNQGEFMGSIDWPGRQWHGPSDTNEGLGDPFPAGDYHVSVTFAVPGVGSLTARLPIEVFTSPSTPAGGASCEVGGQVYASGQDGIDDPSSCNTCTCEDGELLCTEIACYEPCPDGTAFGMSCSQCGPTDACEVVRTDCLPTCTEQSDCSDPGLGFCGSDGLCKNVCG